MLCSSLYLKKSNLIIAIVGNYLTWSSLWCFSRMVIQTVEAFCFGFAFYYWKQAGRKEDDCQRKVWRKVAKEDRWQSEKIARFFIGLNFIMRPTSLIDWVPILIKDLLQCKRHSFMKGFIINALHGILSIGICIVIESYYFEGLTYTTWNFFDFNFIKSGANLYGMKSRYFYLT